MHDLSSKPHQRLANALPDEPSAALLEALWRAEELAAALDAAQREVAALRGNLIGAEQTIAELTELGDAAQAALEKLRKALSEQQEQVNRAVLERGAIATELFEHRARAFAELRVLGEALYRATARRSASSRVSSGKFVPGWFGRLLRRLGSGSSHRPDRS